MSSSPSLPVPSGSGSSSTLDKSKPFTSKNGTTDKPANVFQNDGSFLQHFQGGSKPTKAKTEEEKKAQSLAQKKAFDDRFKKRGKRPLPPASDESSKKPKQELSAYEKEIKMHEARSLKDAGSGVRSIMK